MITIRDLWRVRDVLNISELARRAGLNPDSLHTRIRRLTELNVEDAHELERELTALGIKIQHEPKTKKAAQ